MAFQSNAKKLSISLLLKVSSSGFGKSHLYLYGPLLGRGRNSWKTINYYR